MGANSPIDFAILSIVDCVAENSSIKDFDERIELLFKIFSEPR